MMITAVAVVEVILAEAATPEEEDMAATTVEDTEAVVTTVEATEVAAAVALTTEAEAATSLRTATLPPKTLASEAKRTACATPCAT